jgi:hypothetical protein
VRRALLALLLAVGLAPGLWFYRTGAPPNHTVAVRFTPVPLPPAREIAPHLGVFTLAGAWAMTSPNSDFGGYSALLALPGGRLLAISDSARSLAFSPPGASPAPPEAGQVLPHVRHCKLACDTESATRDTATGTIWIGREYLNAISRHDPALHLEASIRPAAMRDWGANTGPEAMVRLADGRFVVLEEGFTGLFESRLHHAVLFPRDPLLGDRPKLFTFAGAPGFSPTDMAQMPDGRVLILMRRLVWPFPLRFAGRILLADPAAIRAGAPWAGIEVARLSSSLPNDNFEGMAIEPRPDGRLTVWLISDDNSAATQRTMLWKLAVDPARLPDTRKKARSQPRASR